MRSTFVFERRCIKMAKLTAWLVTLVGLILTLEALSIYTVPYSSVIIALAVLVVGIGKLMRNYRKKR